MLHRYIPLFSFLSLSFLILTGCGPIYKMEYSYVPPHSSAGNMCISQCIQARSMCEQMCQIRIQQCRMASREEAYYEYESYKHERHHEGKKVRKDVSDFDRGSFNCEQSCNCAPSFNACYASCGGQVVEKRVCVAFCDKT